MFRQIIDVAKARKGANYSSANTVSSLRAAGLLGILATSLFLSSVLYAQDPELSVPAKSNLMTRTYYDGAETIGRVGQVAILRRDVLHQIKKLAHMQYLSEIEKLPEEEREPRPAWI